MVWQQIQDQPGGCAGGQPVQQVLAQRLMQRPENVVIGGRGPDRVAGLSEEGVLQVGHDRRRPRGKLVVVRRVMDRFW
jgi:hypothetical protein